MSKTWKISLVAPAFFALLVLRTASGVDCIVDDFEDGGLFDGVPLVWEENPDYPANATIEDGNLIIRGRDRWTPAFLYLPEFEGWQNLRMKCSMVGPGRLGLTNNLSLHGSYYGSVFEDGDLGITKCTGSTPDTCDRLANEPGSVDPAGTYQLMFLRSGDEIELRYWEVGVEPRVIVSITAFDNDYTEGPPGIFYNPLANGSYGIVYEFEICPSSPPGYLRGDGNNDGAANIADAQYLLNFLFLGGPNPACEDAADVNHDGAVNIADAQFILNHLFLGGPEPDAPYPDCGPDPEGESLRCESSACQ